MTFLVRLTILLLLLLLFPKTVRSSDLLSIGDEHLPFIIDVCKLHRITSTIFLFAESIKEMEKTTMIFKWMRGLSREGFTTSNLYFSELHESLYYAKRILRPHYITVISNPNEINEFSLATSNFDMSYASWLVIFIYEGSDSDYCHNPPGNIFHLKFNSKVLVRCGTENILREWYSIDPNRTEIVDVATWSLEKGIITIALNSLYERRHNLRGLVMRAIVVNNSPFVNVNKNGELDGMFGKILTELCGSLNFTFDIVSEVNEYGSWNSKEKIWSGAVGELYAGRADISISDFSMTNARLNVVDFTFPLVLSKISVYFRKPQGFAINWSSYFLTFSNYIWVVISGILVSATMLLVFLKIRNGTDCSMGHLLSDNFLEIWGIFCQQGLADFPERSSLKIAYFSMFLLSVVLWAAYSAALISFLTSAVIILPFRSLEDFVADGTYQFAVTRGTADYDLFANFEHPLSKNIMELMLKEEELPNNVLEGFIKICKNRKLAIYSSNEIENIINLHVPCKIVSFETGCVESLAMILSKHNPFTELINYHLQKFIKNGMVNRLKGVKFEQNLNYIRKPEPVYINSVISLILLIMIGIILSICILIIEKCVFVYKIKEDNIAKHMPLKKSVEFYLKKKKSINNIGNYHENRKCARVKY